MRLTKPRRASGFTLVEVLVALIVVAVALPALLSQVMAQVDGTAVLRDKTIAHWVAQNRWTQLRLQRRLTGQLLQGSDTGSTEMVDREWYWHIATEPTAADGLRRITIRVGLEEDVEANGLVMLSGFLDD